MVFYLMVGMCLAFEIHKLFDFKTFYRLNYIVTVYRKQLKTHLLNSGEIFSSIRKISYLNLAYMIVLFGGLFTFQSYFFTAIIILMIITGELFKLIKNKYAHIVIYSIDIFLTVSILVLIIINRFWFNMGELELLKYLISCL